MAAPTITYTFTNATAADATEVNQNFTDIINGLTDGTKDLTIGLLTANGNSSFNANVTLGNSVSDDIIFNGRVDGDIDPKTAATSTLGDATQTWRSLYLDNTTTDGGAIYFDGGSTEFLKASADGTTLTAGGFTTVALPAVTASGDLTVDTDTLKVDSTNNRVGIGTTSPTVGTKLDVNGRVDATEMRTGSDVGNGTAIAQVIGRTAYLVISSSNFGVGNDVRSRVDLVLTNNEGTGIAVTTNIAVQNAQTATYSVSGSNLVINGLPSGNNKCGVYYIG